MFGEEGETREEPGEAEGGAAAGTERKRSPGKKMPAEESQRKSLAEERAGLPEEAPGPEGNVSGCAQLGTSVFMVWVWLLTEANKKGRRKGNVSYFLQQKCEPRFLFLKTRPQKCCPSVLRRQQHPGFRGCVDSRANSGFLWNALTSGFT